MNEKTQDKPAPASGAKPERRTVKLTAPHIHRGVEHVPGAKLELRADQAQRLIEAGRAVAA